MRNTVLHPQARPTLRRARSLGLGLGLAALALAAQAATDPFVGARASGQASHIVLTCSTCGTGAAVDDSGQVGGPGTPQASWTSAGPGWAAAASASVATPSMLPELGAFAFADIIPPAPPGSFSTFLYSASANAEGTQRFDYTGSSPATYTFDYTLSGTFTLGQAQAVSLMQVFGAYTVYGSDYNPFGGEFHGTVLDFDFQTGSATEGGTHPFSFAGNLSFTVQPGSSFYVVAKLNAFADAKLGVIGAVDASHTLTAHFTQGDLSQLVPAVTAPVPEPGTAALLLAGAALLLGTARLRRGAP
jgi:hypothetical protein